MNLELHLLFYVFLFGVKMHIGYDGIRILRRLFVHRDWLVNLEDFLFWCISSLYFFAEIYQRNDGIIRWYMVLGGVCGALLYHFLLSRFLMPCIETGIKRLKFKRKQVTLLLRDHLPSIDIRKVAYGKQKKKKTQKEKQSAE